MIDTIYIEERAIGLPKTDEILSRFPKATLVYHASTTRKSLTHLLKVSAYKRKSLLSFLP